MITREILPDQFFEDSKPLLDELIFSEVINWPDYIAELANVEGGSFWGSQSTEQTGVGAAVEVASGSQISFDEIAQGNSTLFTYLKYVVAVQIVREMIEDQRFGEVQDIYRSMGPALYHTKQTVFFNNFNNGFTTNGYDGVPFFSTSHPLVKAGGVQANRPSTDVDLSETTLRAAITTIASWLTHEGFKTYYMPQKVIVSNSGIYDAIILTKSDLRPGTANNDTNSLTRWNLTAMQSPYLTDADAWFIKCDRHGLKFKQRQAPRKDSWIDKDNQSMKTSLDERYDTKHSSWYGYYGSSGN